MIDKEPHKADRDKKQGGKKNYKNQNQNKAYTAQLQGKCYQCVSTAHKPRECKLDRTSKCSSCGKPGHLAKVSLSLPSTSNSTATAKKVEKANDAAETSPGSSENCGTMVVRGTSTEVDAPPALL